MIRAIKEINFPEYATLNQATVSLVDMDERIITTQIKIDGDIVPDFSGWELEFKGERFVLTTDSPQAVKDNTTRCSIVDLQFKSWIIEELKRYFFVQMAQTDPDNPNTVVANQYIAGLRLSLPDFVEAFNKVLTYYFGDIVEMVLNPNKEYPADVVNVEISNTKIWDVLKGFYDKFGVRWYITYDQKYKIMVDFDAEEIDHIFSYGYKGGLLKFERQVDEEDVENIIIGRGGEKNLPYRYFKKEDPNNPDWTADPDAIPELENIYFDRLRDINFRWYVRGWKTNPRRRLWPGDSVQPYDTTLPPEESLFAYEKGHFDEKFDPVEYVKDDESIEKYGERWGARDDDDEIFPTIQGIERPGLGRVDEVVDVEQVTTDDIDAANAGKATYVDIDGEKTISTDTPHNAGGYSYKTLYFGPFTVPDGQTGGIRYSWLEPSKQGRSGLVPFVTSDGDPYIVINTDECEFVAEDLSTYEELSPYGLLPGTYRLRVTIAINCIINTPKVQTRPTVIYQTYTYGLQSLQLVLTKDAPDWSETFNIWVKNIWETTQGSRENDTKYSMRVWGPILGDRLGSEAKVAFSDGPMAASSDYEFAIAGYPVPDRTKTIVTKDKDGNTITVPSEWRIPLFKSDAEIDTLGLYVPNSKSAQARAGEHILFLGIDMPFSYVVWAEERLNEVKREHLDTKKDANPIWVIGIDKVRANTLEEEDFGELLADKFSTGAKLTITDPRFTPGVGLVLQAASVTYSWHEDQMVPDIEVVLSEKVLESRDLPQDVADSAYSKSAYLINKQISGVYNYINAVVAKRSGAGMDFDQPIAFGSLVQSKDFRQGFVGGSGWCIYRDGEGNTVLEVDKILARNDLSVNNFVLNQVAYVGGKQIRSSAAMEITAVAETNDGYICYFDQKNGSVANMFKINDIALGETYDPENNETKYFRRLVTAVDVNSVTLSKTVASGTGIPAVGDTIVQFGNTTDPNRQFAIISDVIGGGYEQMLSGLSSVSAAGNEYYFAGTRLQSEGDEFVSLLDKDGNQLLDSDGLVLGYNEETFSTSPRWFVGDKTGEYSEWQNGALTVRGRIYVRNSGGTYSDMAGYLDTIDYLQNALPEDEEGVTTITGGVVLSKIIGVVRTGDLVAGINASSLGDDVEHGVLMIFAGANGAGNVSSAKFRVYEDGHVVASDIVANGGEIGGFKIANTYIGTDPTVSTGINISSAGFSTRSTNKGVTIASEYTRQNAQIEVVDNDTHTPAPIGIFLRKNSIEPILTGVYLNVQGASTSNRAIYVNSGDIVADMSNSVFRGLRRPIGTSTDVDQNTYTTVVDNSSSATYTLPQSPVDGEEHLFLHTTANQYTISAGSEYIYNVTTSGGGYAHSYNFSNRGCVRLVYSASLVITSGGSTIATGAWILAYYG